MLGTESVPTDTLDIDQKVYNKYLIPEDERKHKYLAREMNQKGYRDLQLSTSKWDLQLVSLVMTVDLPRGSLVKAWAVLKDEYNLSEEEDKMKLLGGFQNTKLLNAKVNITEWLASLSTQVMKSNKLSHLIDDDYMMTHILASLPPEYSTVLDHAKIDWRSKTLTLIELNKRLKEKYMQL